MSTIPIPSERSVYIYRGLNTRICVEFRYTPEDPETMTQSQLDFVSATDSAGQVVELTDSETDYAVDEVWVRIRESENYEW